MSLYFYINTLSNTVMKIIIRGNLILPSIFRVIITEHLSCLLSESAIPTYLTPFGAKTTIITS